LRNSAPIRVSGMSETADPRTIRTNAFSSAGLYEVDIDPSRARATMSLI